MSRWLPIPAVHTCLSIEQLVIVRSQSIFDRLYDKILLVVENVLLLDQFVGYLFGSVRQ